MREAGGQVFGRRQDSQAGARSNAQPPRIPLLPREKELHPAPVLRMGSWSWLSLPQAGGEQKKLGTSQFSLLPQKSARSEGQRGTCPTLLRYGGTSAPLSRVRRRACPPPCCCAEPRAGHNTPRWCRGQQRSPLPRSPSLQGQRPRSCVAHEWGLGTRVSSALMLMKRRLGDKGITACN